MALIPQDELTTLKAASAVKTVAESAALDQERMSVAHAINSAANTGETRTIINRRLSDAMKSELETNGYVLKYNVAKANVVDEVCISWE